MSRILLAVLTAACLSTAPAIGLAASDPKPDATVEVSGGSVALGVGIDWSRGTLHYNGQDVPVRMKGLSVARVGIGSVNASGSVYNLRQLSDFAGNYTALSAGAALAGGAGVAAMQNEKGVVVHLRSTTVGMDLDLGVKGIQVTLEQ